MTDIVDDPRFLAALAHFEAGDWLEATDAFEELFFEAVRDEVDFVRIFLQLATGLHHVSRGQRNAAVERLEEGIRVMGVVASDRGFDLEAMRGEARRAVREIKRGAKSQSLKVSKRKPL